MITRLSTSLIAELLKDVAGKAPGAELWIKPFDAIHADDNDSEDESESESESESDRLGHQFQLDLKRRTVTLKDLKAEEERIRAHLQFVGADLPPSSEEVLSLGEEVQPFYSQELFMMPQDGIMYPFIQALAALPKDTATKHITIIKNAKGEVLACTKLSGFALVTLGEKQQTIDLPGHLMAFYKLEKDKQPAGFYLIEMAVSYEFLRALINQYLQQALQTIHPLTKSDSIPLAPLQRLFIALKMYKKRQDYSVCLEEADLKLAIKVFELTSALKTYASERTKENYQAVVVRAAELETLVDQTPMHQVARRNLYAIGGMVLGVAAIIVGAALCTVSGGLPFGVTLLILGGMEMYAAYRAKSSGPSVSGACRHDSDLQELASSGHKVARKLVRAT